MKIAKELILREIAGEYILIPIGDTLSEFNGMINLSETGKFIWEHLETTANLRELLDLILAEYQVDEHTALQDTTEFITGLIKHGIIIPTNEDRTW